MSHLSPTAYTQSPYSNITQAFPNMMGQTGRTAHGTITTAAASHSRCGDLILDQVALWSPQRMSTKHPSSSSIHASIMGSLWIVSQIGPTPGGSNILVVDHGPPFKSMVPVIHQVGHGVPQLLSTKNAIDRNIWKNQFLHYRELSKS